MAELKTKRTNQRVDTFLKSIADEARRSDCFKIVEIMKAATKSEPAMWGTSIVGFGSFQYGKASGKGYEWPLIGFSPRKQDLTLYIMPGLELGKHKTGKSCLYIKRLADIDLPTLKQLIKQALADMRPLQSSIGRRTK
jgi:hypothetical protein